jgi:hypothetical protein
MVLLAGKCKFNLRRAAGEGVRAKRPQGAGAKLPEGTGGALCGPEGPLARLASRGAPADKCADKCKAH